MKGPVKRFSKTLGVTSKLWGAEGGNTEDSVLDLHVNVTVICCFLLGACELIHFYVSWHDCEKRLQASSCLSIRPSAWNNSAFTRRIFMKFDIF